MDNHEILKLYESVADITDQMLVAARGGDWEQLAVLETRCARQVEVIKQREQSHDTLSLAARQSKVKIIRKILDDDRQIRNITQPWMAELSVLMNSAGTERKLSQAYGVNQSG